jgi:CAAX protease family protein
MTTYDTALRTVQIAQWSRGRVLTVWAAAALPMGLLAWVVAPILAHAFSGPAALSGRSPIA